MGSGRDESSDYESSCSSITGGISDMSFGSSSSISVRSLGAVSFASSRSHKPHRSNDALWASIARLRASSGLVTLNHFHLLHRLGSGDLGNVYLCRLKSSSSSSSSLYAMKVVDKEALAIRNKLQRAETEKEILRTLDHPFLPTLYAEFDASHFSCIVMEFCSGGDLHVARQRQPGRRFPLSSAKFYVAETLLALEYLHMMGVVYRDLKPENVLVRDDGHIMLSDFDLSFKCEVVPRVFKQRLAEKNNKGSGIQPVLSCLYGGASKCTRNNGDDDQDHNEVEGADTELVAEPFSARSKSFVGTHEYLAPEVISGLGHGSAVDWWTLGVFLYEMLYGRTPFKGEDNKKTLINIIKQPVSFPKVAYSEEMMRAQDLITKLLVKNPKKRIGSMKGSVEIKRHEFFKGVNWALIRSVKPPEVPRELRRSARSKAPAVPTPPLMMLTRNQRDQPYKIPPQHFDYF
ncbi:hypothetical protein J5N97_013275 [Dioscorea zingiberensis]|uniref:non-specific serine/threonine protein kinase n=1 Tax=Dioscorea zingiberensis TaxID=325984 RepID=A0A9D5CQF4_9LILI|nr:hypothetical protein J5N97_013275 [Dioscorea zingiberensis]